MRFHGQLFGTVFLSLLLNTAFAQVLDIDNPPDAANLRPSFKTYYSGSYSCSFGGNINVTVNNTTTEMAMQGLVKIKSDGAGKFTKGGFVNTTNLPGGGSSTCIYSLNTTDSSYVTYKNGKLLEKLVWVFEPDLSTDQTTSPNTCAAGGFFDYLLAQPTSFGYQNSGGKVSQVAMTSEYIHLNDDSGQLVPFAGGGHCNRLSRDVE